MKILLGGGAFFLSGLLSAMGLGGGSALIIYLSLILGLDQKLSQGLSLGFFIPTAVFSLYFHNKNGYLFSEGKTIFKNKGFILILVGGIIGTIIGGIFLGKFENNCLRRIFGILLLLIGIKDGIMTIKQIKLKKKNE